MRISGGVLTYNSEQWIEQTAGFLRPIVDQLVVAIDDMTTDKTSQLAVNAGADAIYRFTWRHDYAYAKNLLLDQLTGDWVILLDDDEKLSPLGAKKLRELIERIERDNLPYDTIQLAQKQQYPNWYCDDDNYIKELYPNSHVQIFRRNIPSHRYINAIHEGIILNNARMFPFEETEKLGIFLYHHAWKGSREKWELVKHNYYTDLAMGKKFEENEKPF